MKDWKFALVTLLIVGAALTVAELICTEKPVEREYTPSSDVEYTIATLRAIDRASQHIREKITLGHYADISIDKLEETINTDQEFYILMFLAQED